MVHIPSPMPYAPAPCPMPHLLGLLPPVLHHVVRDVLRVLLPQHGQPEHELHAEQVRIPSPPPPEASRSLWTRWGTRIAAGFVFWRLAVDDRLAAYGARDLGV